MSSIYSEPVNTETELYIGFYNDHKSFSDIADHITAHFGDQARLDQFDISIERIQVTGCSCCNNNSDYNLYLVITKRKEPCQYTKDLLVDALNKQHWL